MDCSNCGAPLAEGAAFCPACGVSAKTPEPPEDAATTVSPAGEAAPAATMVAPAATTEATQVMAAGPPPVQTAGAGGPPPAPPVVAGAGQGGSRRKLYVAIALIAAVAIALVAIWFFVWRGTSGNEFVGTWAPVNGDPGGLIVSKNGGAFKVTIVQADGGTMGPLQGKIKDGKLEISLAGAGLPSGMGSLASQVKFTATYEKGTGHIVVELVGLGALAGQSTEKMEMRKVAAIPTATPSAGMSSMPTPETSESPSPASSAWSSPTPTGTAISGTEADTAIKTGVANIVTGIEAWATDNGGAYPPVATVNEAGLGGYVDPWPQNPVTGSAMVPGSGPGDLDYEVATDSSSFTLTTSLTDGSTYSLP